jgi:mono/diheme cytochrome c family protein
MAPTLLLKPRVREPIAGPGVIAIALACIAGIVPAARADLSGAYAGQLQIGRGAETAAVAAALTQSGRVLVGTIALTVGDPMLDGAYHVQGRANGRRFRLSGVNPTGGRFAWAGTVASTGVQGRARLLSASARMKGRLALSRRQPTGDGSSCDAVFTQNQDLFTSQVMGQVLVPICATCHVAGGQAQSTRLRVLRDDPLGTARGVALLIDRTNPAASLLLEKPLAIVPHGGGQQLGAGSTQAAILEQWADLVAQAQCSGAASGPATPAELYVQTCGGCHGSDGVGTNLPGRIDVRCSVKSLLVDAVRHGRGNGAMPAFPTSALPPDQLGTIVDYLAGLCTGRPQDVYASNCASCHGPTGGGGRNADGVGGPNIRCAEAGDFGEAVRGGAENMPSFAELGATRIGALAAYVRGLCALGGGGGDN